MITTTEFVNSARRFMEEQSRTFASQYLKVKDKYDADERIQTIGWLTSSLDLTTESILVLTENETVWDLPILFRSVLDGSARAMFLLSAPTPEEAGKRWDEYANVLLKSDMASSEQEIGRLAKSIQDGSLEGKVAEMGHEMVDELKTAADEGASVQAVKSRWRFRTVSKVLRKECALWAQSADLWEMHFASANALVHKSNLGNRQLFEKYRQIRLGELPCLCSATMVLVSCVILQFDRLFLFLEALGLDSRPLVGVRSRHMDFFDKAYALDETLAASIKTQLEPPP